MLNKTVPGSGVPSSLDSLGLSVALSQAPDSSSEGPFLPDRFPPAALPLNSRLSEPSSLTSSQG